MSSNKLFHIEELIANVSDNKELLTQLLQVFLATTPGEFARMRKALEEKDMAQVSGIAHKFKSTFQSLGMRSVAVHLERLQRLALLPGNEAEVQELVQRVSQDFEVVASEINAELIRLKS